MNMCPIFRGTDMNFHQFLDESLTDVLFSSISTAGVPIVIENKIGQKIKLLSHRGKRVFNSLFFFTFNLI